MTTENPAVELAQIREQLTSMSGSIEEIKHDVSQIKALDRTIAEMTVKGEQSQREISTLWSRIDAHRQWEVTHDKESLEVRQRIKDEVTAVDSKFEAVVNKGRGAFWLAGIVVSLVQGIMATAVIWTFTHVSEADALNKVQQYRIEQLERKLNISEPK